MSYEKALVARGVRIRAADGSQTEWRLERLQLAPPAAPSAWFGEVREVAADGTVRAWPGRRGRLQVVAGRLADEGDEGSGQ